MRRCKIEPLYGMSLHLDYYCVFAGCPHIQFEVVFNDDLIKQLRPEHWKEYSQKMYDILRARMSDLDNVRTTDDSTSTEDCPLIKRPIPHDLAKFLDIKPNSIKTAIPPATIRENHVVLNTKCITVSDYGLKEKWDAIKTPLFHMLNDSGVKVIIIGEKEPSHCREYDIHKTFSIYKDIVNGDLLDLEDLTQAETTSLYDQKIIDRNIAWLRHSLFNIHIGEGGGQVVYSHCNNLIALTGRELQMFKFIDNPYFTENTFDQNTFLEMVRSKLG
jgi:hypothetical protein